MAATPTTSTETGSLVVDETEPVDEVEPSVVRCRSCDAELTTLARAIRRGGDHEHTFRNPAGYSWTLACFRDAPGCAAAGEPTTEATWFAGHAWCFAHCAACARHLGWWFLADGASFVGLIVTRIVRS